MPRAELADPGGDSLTDQMMSAAGSYSLNWPHGFGKRCEIADLKKELRGMDAAGLS